MRTKGEGTIGREDGGWVARLELPTGSDGKRRRVRRRATTKSEARAILRELRTQLEEVENPDGLRRTVDAAVATFLATQPMNGRANKTVELERWRASLVVAGLGGRQLGKLSVTDCDDFIRLASEGAFGGRPLSTETLRRVRRLLIRVLDNERRVGNLGRNVAELSLMPSGSGRGGPPSGRLRNRLMDDDDDSGRRSLTPEEFLKLWNAARQPLAVVIDFCGRNGLRPAEARALRWERVDLDARTIMIDRQLSSEDEPTYTKTAGAHRLVRFDSVSASTLKAWQSIQHDKRSRAGDRWRDHDLVISTRYGTPINRYNLRRMLTTACEEAGIDRIVPYELRHTAITLQRRAGRDSAEVADWAGTSERMVNEIYRHRLDIASHLKPIEIDGITDPGSGPVRNETTTQEDRT